MLASASGSPSLMSATRSTSGASLMSALIQPGSTWDPQPQFKRLSSETCGIEHPPQHLVGIEVLAGDRPGRARVLAPVGLDPGGAGDGSTEILKGEQPLAGG